jgi:hypothetical protein
MKTVSKKTQNTVIDLSTKFTKGYKRVAANDKKFDQQKDKDDKTQSVRDASTASKITPLDESTVLNDTLLKIYTFLQKSFEQDKLHKEKIDNFAEERELESKKRHAKLMKAIETLMGTSEGTASGIGTAAAIAGGSAIGPSDIAAGVAGGSFAARALPALALTGVVGGVVAGGAASSMVATSILASEQGKPLREAFEGKSDPYGTLGAMSGDTGAAASILSSTEDTNENAIQKKKMRLLAERPSNKKSKLFWKDPELQEKYLKEIGWDEKTGTTAAERKVSAVSNETQTTPASQEQAPANTSPNVIPVDKTLSTGEEIVSQQSTAAPVPSTPSTSKVNDVIQESNAININQMTAPAETVVNNVNTALADNKPSTPERVKIPSVRNLEPTFQKMIIYSTRLV